MATKNIVPRENGEGSIGTSGKKWDKVFTNDVILADGESVMAKFMNVPDKSTTLSGYGISDAYTKTETDNMLDDVEDSLANKLDKTEAEDLLAGKLDKTEAEENYLPLSGGNITNTLTVKGKAVERVNSSGANYIRFESGLQICWATITGDQGTVNTHTFPVKFSSTPTVIACGNMSTSTDTYSVDNSRIVTIRSTSTTQFKWQISSPSYASGTAGRYVAFGQWK